MTDPSVTMRQSQNLIDLLDDRDYAYKWLRRWRCLAIVLAGALVVMAIATIHLSVTITKAQ